MQGRRRSGARGVYASLLALVAALLLVELSIPVFADALLWPVAGAVAAPCDEDAAAPCAPHDGEQLSPVDGTPSLLAVAPARTVPALPPIASLAIVVLPRPDARIVRASQATRPSEGIDVPACRTERRWLLAHATITASV